MGKKVWSTLVVVGVIASFIMDVPAAVEKVSAQLPAWMQDHRFWVVLIGCGVLGLIWIPWRRKKRVDKPETNPDFMRLKALISYMKHVLASAYERGSGDEFTKFILRETEINTPELVHRLYGKRESDRFVRKIADTRKQSSDDGVAVLEALISHLQGFVEARMIEIMEKRRNEEQALKAATADLENKAKQLETRLGPTYLAWKRSMRQVCAGLVAEADQVTDQNAEQWIEKAKAAYLATLPEFHAELASLVDAQRQKGSAPKDIVPLVKSFLEGHSTFLSEATGASS
jgi:hypothetical protein